MKAGGHPMFNLSVVVASIFLGKNRFGVLSVGGVGPVFRPGHEHGSSQSKCSFTIFHLHSSEVTLGWIMFEQL